MRGHLQIIDLRRSGMRPDAISFVDAEPGRYATPEMDIALDLIPTVYVAGDNPDLADLRFATGCDVFFDAKACTERTERWLDALKRVAPRGLYLCLPSEALRWL